VSFKSLNCLVPVVWRGELHGESDGFALGGHSIIEWFELLHESSKGYVSHILVEEGTSFVPVEVHHVCL